MTVLVSARRVNFVVNGFIKKTIHLNVTFKHYINPLLTKLTLLIVKVPEEYQCGVHFLEGTLKFTELQL